MKRTSIIKKLCIVHCALCIVILLPLSGCAPGGWQGTFNRENNATFDRGILSVTSVKSSGINFSFTVYNGNVAGRLDGFAEFGEGKTTARWTSPMNDRGESEAVIDFFLQSGGIDVTFLGVDPEDAARAEEAAVSIGDTSYTYPKGGTEEDILGFSRGGSLSGRFKKGKVEYINTSISGMHQGVFPADHDKQLQSITTKEVYTRFMDCFVSVKMWVNEDSPTRDNHHNEIGGYIYYGSNPMQEFAAVIICYDDGTVSAAVSREGASLIYVTNNSVYTNKTDPPEPVTAWVRAYNSEQERKSVNNE